MKEQSTDRARQAYQRPVLENLGSLQDLTAGGMDFTGTEDSSGYTASSSGSS
jgi:hypothetical protein